MYFDQMTYRNKICITSFQLTYPETGIKTLLTINEQDATYFEYTTNT